MLGGLACGRPQNLGSRCSTVGLGQQRLGLPPSCVRRAVRTRQRLPCGGSLVPGLRIVLAAHARPLGKPGPAVRRAGDPERAWRERVGRGGGMQVGQSPTVRLEVA